MSKRLNHVFAVFSGLICIAIYIITLHPSVAFIDSGELAAACYTFGVPHPTGYPLFLVLGFLVSHLPLPGTVIYKLNLLSAAESTAAVIITYYSVLYMMQSLKLSGKGKKDLKEGNINFYLIALISAVAFGLTKSVWFDATQIEVYSLHTLFIAALFFIILKIYFSLKSPVKKYWAYLFLFTGLSFANHSTTIYLIPSILILFYYQYRENRLFAKSVLIYLLLLLPGLFLYAVLIAAASAKPYLNWSDPENLGNLLSLVRGSDFSHLMYTSSTNFTKNAASFFSSLFNETAIFPGIFGIAGLFYLWKLDKRLSIILLLTVLICLLNSFNYSTIEIQSFFIVVYFILAVNVSIGILLVTGIFRRNAKADTKSLNPTVLVISVLLFSLSAGYNFKENNNSSNYVNEDITVNTLMLLKPNSVLLTYDYAFVYSSSFYFQQVEHLRPDVKVFNVRFLSVPWYLQTIQKYYPDIYNCFNAEAEEYINKFNLDDPSNAARLGNLIKAFIGKISAKFPFYLTIDFILSREMNFFLTDYAVKPVGLVYRLEGKNEPYDPMAGLGALNMKFRKYEPVGYHKNKMYVSTPGVFYETAYYHYKNGNNDLALKFLDKALEINGNFADAVNLKNQINKGINK